VGWTGSGLSGTNIIDDSFLSLVDIGYAPEFSGTNVSLSMDATNGAVVCTLTAVDSAMDTIAYSIVSGNASNTFAIDTKSGRITIADNSVLRADAVTNFNLIVQAQDSGYGGMYPPKSSLVSVNVSVVDTSPPAIWTGKGTDANWSTATNWNSGTPGERRKLIFNGFLGQTNVNDLLLKADTVTINTAGFNIRGNSMLLHGGIISRGNSTWAIHSSLEGPQSFISALGTLSIAGSVNNNGYDLTLQANTALRIDGAIHGSGGLIKSGPNRATLTASNAYTGPTTINLGVLALMDAGDISRSSSITLRSIQPPAVLDGSGLAGRFTIPTNQILRGWGSVVGPVTIEGTLNLISPSAYIPLIVSNRLSLAGTTILRPFRVGTQETNWVLQVVGELQCGGNLIVTNYSSPLPTFPSVRLGDTFKVFEAKQFSGAFTNIVLPRLANGLIWETDHLTQDGTIRVSIVPTHVVVPAFTGRSMVIRFTSVSGVNYAIESSTSLEPNSIWSIVAQRPGTGSAISVLLNLDPADTRRFFRLRAY
jgi:autotransporter-associated beta strand protein